jgi:hypothetical protein
MGNYWKSIKDQDREKTARQSLHLLLSLTDKAMSKNDSKWVLRHLGHHANLLGQDFLPEDAKPKFLGEIREHLSGRIETIMDASLQLLDDFPLWTIKGGIEVKARPVGVTYKPGRSDHFILKTLIQDPEESAEDPLKKAKDLVDACLVDLIYILDLKPSRFRKCQECGAYFYQTTSRKKNYCSSGCAAKIRKRRFIGRKKEKGVVYQKSQAN